MSPLAVAYYVFLVISILILAQSAIVGVVSLSPVTALWSMIMGVVAASPAILAAYLLRDYKHDQ